MRCPVTIWHGNADELVPPASSHELACPRVDCRRGRVPGAGHFVAYTHTVDILRGLAPDADVVTNPARACAPE